MMASPNDPSPGRTTQPPEDLWEKALDNLKANSKTPIELGRTDRREILEEVLLVVQTTEKACQRNRWKWKNKKGETVILRDVFVKMVTWIEKFKGIGDTIVQYDPGHAALPWAAVRFVLQAAINDVQTNGAMLEGLEIVFNLIAKFEVVERLYLRRSSGLQQGLTEAIITTYTSILEFLLEANQYFAQKTILRIAKSILQLEEITTRYVAKIKSNSNRVEEFVRLISGEILSNTDRSVTQMVDKISLLETHSNILHDIDAHTENLQATIDNELESLQSVLKDLNQPITRIATQISAIEDNLKEEERLRVFEWLTTVPYTSHHLTKVKSLLRGSGQWLLQTTHFVEWMNSSTSSILWLHGIPGSGKSMLVAYVIEYIRSQIPNESGQIPLAYFYCARTINEPERSDPVELLRSIVEQLSCSDEDLPIRLPVVERYKAMKKKARGRKPEKLDLSECMEVILELLETNPAVIVIDGLDECDPAKRQDLLDVLQTIIKEASNVVQVFVSSRDDHDLVHRLAHAPNLYIRAADNTRDIERFVVSRVDEAIFKERILCGEVSNDLRTKIIETLIRKANGMFRLVSLHIENLCDPARIKTKANVLDALVHLPRDLQVSYNSILARISNSQDPNPELASRILKWLLCARESLPSSGFIFAVSWDMDGLERLQRSEVLSICCNLVVYDGETDKFRFAHLSVQEYLERLENFSPAESNALAAEQCLAFLTHDGAFRIPPVTVTFSIPENEWGQALHFQEQANKTSTSFSSSTTLIPKSAWTFFSSHADEHWYHYAWLAGGLIARGRLKVLLQKFLLFERLVPPPDGRQFVAWFNRILDLEHSYRGSLADALRQCLPPNPLFVACALDFPEIVQALVNSSASITPATDNLYLNCVKVSAQLDRLQVLDILFDQCRWLSSPEFYMQTAMFEAVEWSQARILKAILTRAGKMFVTVADILRVLEAPRIGSYENGYGHVLQLLFQNNIDLEVTGENSELEVKSDATEELTAHLHIKMIQTILKRAHALGLYVNADLLVLFAEKIEEEFELTWAMLEEIMKEDEREAEREGLLQLVVETKPKISLPALHMLVSFRDEATMQQILEFQKIKVTDHVVRAAAGNVEHGKQILRLFLEREAEETGASEIRKISVENITDY